MDRLAKGDRVVNPITGKTRIVVDIPHKPRNCSPVYEVGYGDNSVSVTAIHPIHTAQGTKTADALALGRDQIMGADGQWHTLSVYRQVPNDQCSPTWNLVTVAEDGSVDSSDLDNMVLTDGIVTGDYTLQNQLQAATQNPVE